MHRPFFLMLAAAVFVAGACGTDPDREAIGTSDAAAAEADAAEPSDDSTETTEADKPEKTTTTTEAPKASVNITETGFSVEPVGYDATQQRVSVGAIIANTGGATAYSVNVSVTLLSADGMALDTSNETLTFLDAGETGYVVTEHSLPAEPAVASIDVTGTSSADEGFMDVEEIVAPTADVRVTVESFGGYVRGSLTNPVDEVVDSLIITCIVRDGAGAIIGGGYTYSDTIAPGATVAFQTSLSEQVAARATGAECRAAGTSITSVG